MLSHAPSASYSHSYCKRVAMDHPYSGAAGYIYANEVRNLVPSSTPYPTETTAQHPYSAVDHKPKRPHGRLPSPTTSASSAAPRKSHDSSWSTEGTYTRTHAQRPPRTSSSQPPHLPLRVPISHPYQQRSASWIDLTGAEADDGPAPALIVPPPRSSSRPGMRMTPYERDGDPLSLRRSAFVPSAPERRPSWRAKIQRRIRRAMKRLKRLMRFDSS
ncbi:hypothetical protein FB451DRAFT_176193 [Mycena latifolia]|nr:hypothetical protein FB451DRAFT_176193 [Mycena latifolia]